MDATAPSSGWGSGALAGYQFTYDAASRIGSIDSYLDGLTEYTLDNTNQLTGADHTGQTDESYSYDEKAIGPCPATRQNEQPPLVRRRKDFETVSPPITARRYLHDAPLHWMHNLHRAFFDTSHF